MIRKKVVLISTGFLFVSSLAFANAQLFCAYATGGNWANADDINSQVAALRAQQPALSVSAPAIASAGVAGNYPNFEICVSANYGPAKAPTTSQVVCTTANGGLWATPDSINSTIAQLESAGNSVEASEPAVTIDQSTGPNVYPNLELCVTLQY